MIKIINRNKKSNPTDHDLISKLTVKKSFPDYGTMYEVYLGKRRIGFADIDNGKTEISFVNINEEYRRKGVSTFLYDYIEKDLGRKLKPSLDLLDDGDKFWKNRNKRSNPTDLSLLKSIKITKEIDYDYDTDLIVYTIWFRGNEIGHAWIFVGATSTLEVKINYEFQRKGLATYLYNYIEKDLNLKLKPSNDQTYYGKQLWASQKEKARLKKNPLSKSKSKNARTLKTSKTKISR